MIDVLNPVVECCADESEVEQAARARLQGGGLLQADMAAFKAANPACQLADFVRWHSPKDWQPDPSHPQGGMLSDRMSHQVSQHHRNDCLGSGLCLWQITAEFYTELAALCTIRAPISGQMYSFRPSHHPHFHGFCCAVLTQDVFTSGAAKPLCVSKSRACTCEQVNDMH